MKTKKKRKPLTFNSPEDIMKMINAHQVKRGKPPTIILTIHKDELKKWFDAAPHFVKGLTIKEFYFNNCLIVHPNEVMIL